LPNTLTRHWVGEPSCTTLGLHSTEVALAARSGPGAPDAPAPAVGRVGRTSKRDVTASTTKTATDGARAGLNVPAPLDTQPALLTLPAPFPHGTRSGAVGRRDRPGPSYFDTLDWRVSPYRVKSPPSFAV
jgi:hypothetical protein